MWTSLLVIGLVTGPPEPNEVAESRLYDAYRYCEQGAFSSCYTLAKRVERMDEASERDKETASAMAAVARRRGGVQLKKVGRTQPFFQSRMHRVGLGAIGLVVDPSSDSKSDDPPEYHSTLQLTYGWRTGTTKQGKAGVSGQIDLGPFIGVSALEAIGSQNDMAGATNGQRLTYGGQLTGQLNATFAFGRDSAAAAELNLGLGVAGFQGFGGEMYGMVPVKFGGAILIGRVSVFLSSVFGVVFPNKKQAKGFSLGFQFSI